ncbi:MAG: DUF4388 domain-containing protein [bacterium]
MRVLIISSEPRLTELCKAAVGTQHQFSVVAEWGVGQATLFKERFDLVCMDFECLRHERLDAFITIDNILSKEDTIGCLLVRQSSAQTTELQNALQSVREAIDMSLGKQHFLDRLHAMSAQAQAASEHRGQDEHSVETDHVLQMEVELPQLSRGRLTTVPLARLLYTCHVRKASGFLRITAGGRTAEIAFDQGDVKIAPGYASAAEIIGVFAWVGGEYVFNDATPPAGTRESTLSIIEHGISRITNQSLMNDMDTRMALFPVVTNHWEEREDSLDQFTALHGLMRVIDGRSSWSRVLGKMGSLAQEAFKAAYFAVHTDLIHTHETPSIRGVVLTYARDIRLAREKVDEAARQQTKAFRASSEEATALEHELEDALMGMRAQTPHQIFGVWEGCGRQVVQDRFYILVKEHHPDVYGGNVSGRVKQLAQEIFIHVKDTYSELLKLEKGQTVAPPTAESAKPVPMSRTGTAKALAPDARPPSSPRIEPPRAFAERIPSATTATALSDEPSEPRPDVRARIERLSGFRQKQQQRMRRVSSHGSSLETPSEPSDAEFSEISEISDAVDPQAEAEAERQAKLKTLMQKASKVSHPNAPNPARDAFNAGYKLFREEMYQKAFVDFQKAFELAPEEPLYQTFYAYLLFKLNPEKHERAEEILREVLVSGNRQAVPDAYLFMGHIWKARNDQEKAIKHYERAFKLNPGCVEAERELRITAMREKRNTSEPGSFIKNLFKK